MLREDREELYFNLCLENGFYMEAEDGGGGINSSF